MPINPLEKKQRAIERGTWRDPVRPSLRRRLRYHPGDRAELFTEFSTFMREQESRVRELVNRSGKRVRAGVIADTIVYPATHLTVKGHHAGDVTYDVAPVDAIDGSQESECGSGGELAVMFGRRRVRSSTGVQRAGI